MTYCGRSYVHDELAAFDSRPETYGKLKPPFRWSPLWHALLWGVPFLQCHAVFGSSRVGCDRLSNRTEFEST